MRVYPLTTLAVAGDHAASRPRWGATRARGQGQAAVPTALSGTVVLLFMNISTFPTLIERLISPTEKPACGETMYDDYCEQRAWLGL